MNGRTAARQFAVIGCATVVIVLAGCVSTTGSGQGATGGGGTKETRSITGKWQLVTGSDAKGTIAPGNADVTFTFNGRSSGGHGPCNSFGATSTGTTTGPITIVLGIRTEMACADPELNITETRYFSALRNVTTAAIWNGSLVLRGGGDSLRFTRPGK